MGVHIECRASSIHGWSILGNASTLSRRHTYNFSHCSSPDHRPKEVQEVHGSGVALTATSFSLPWVFCLSKHPGEEFRTPESRLSTIVKDPMGIHQHQFQVQGHTPLVNVYDSPILSFFFGSDQDELA